MHILITNDDGISSVGLSSLVQTALSRGHQVTVCAPGRQCSANSQHITLTKPLIVDEVPWKGVQAFSVDGTPTDCVRLAPCLVKEPIDYCISGINNGENAGSAVYYSGTVAAAREAVMCHIPAMAVSIMQDADDDMRAHLSCVALRLAEHFQRIPLPRFTIINLNAPAIPPQYLKPLTICSLSQAYYLDSYERRQSPRGETYFWLTANDTSGVPMEPVEPESDYDFLHRGHMTCTFLSAFSDQNDACRSHLSPFHF